MSQELKLEDTESTVFNLLQEYLKRNRSFDMVEIVPYLEDKLRRSSENISSEGIKKVLISLLRKKMIVKGIALTKTELFHNTKRKQIFDYICANPGSFFYKIYKDLKISSRTITWHLNILEKFGYIKKEHIDNRDVYFDPILDFDTVKTKYFISRQKSQKIIYYLRSNDEGLTKTDLLNATDFHSTTLTKYLNALEAVKVVIEIKIGDTIYFALNKKIKHLLN